MASPDDVFVFRLDIIEGKDFGFDVQALRCSVVFGGEQKDTPFSIAKDRHIWNFTLEWRATRQQMRALQASGRSQCKITVLKKDQDKSLGWVLLDTRKARLNSVYKDQEGEWLSIKGPAIGRDVPQLHVRYQMVEERSVAEDGEVAVMRQLEQKLGNKESSKGRLESNQTPVAADREESGTRGDSYMPQQTHAAEEDRLKPPLESKEHATEGGPLDSSSSKRSSASGSKGSVTAAAPGFRAARSEAQSNTGPTLPPSNTSKDVSEFSENFHSSPDSSVVSAQHSTLATIQPHTFSQSNNAASTDPHPSAIPADPPLSAPHSMPSDSTLPTLHRVTTDTLVQGKNPPAPAMPHFSPEDGPIRKFVLSIELRSFQAGLKLPFNLCSIYLAALLPQDVLDLVLRGGGKPTARMTPLKTYPPIDVARGAEGTLLNGYGSLDFVAGVMALARVLGDDPRVTVEVWNKERFRSDTLLGLASVSLLPLLQDCWVDGYVPVQALMVTPGGPGQPQTEEQIQVGSLRVLVALESPGPANVPHPSSLQPPSVPSGPVNVPHPSSLQPPPVPPELAPAAAASVLAIAARSLNHIQPIGQAPIPGQAQANAALQPSNRRLEHQPETSPTGTGGSVLDNQGIQAAVARAQQLEYETVWQLEAWKRAEEMRWRGEMKEREACRMSALEAEWRRREKQREMDVAAMRQEYEILEGAARKMLSGLEERERRLVLGEESLLRRRRELEREHAARMAEAEAAVRRLQVECEHQLEIERDRSSELVRQKQTLADRLAVSESRFASLEQAFTAFREVHRSSDEAVLQRQLSEAREAASRAEEKASRASKSKAAYKTQVTRLAEQLAKLYDQQHQYQGSGRNPSRVSGKSAAILPSWLPKSRESNALGLRRSRHPDTRNELDQIEEGYENSSSQQQDQLSHLRQQLQVLKASALSQLSPGTSPTRAAPPSEAGNGSPIKVQGIMTGPRESLLPLVNPKDWMPPTTTTAYELKHQPYPDDSDEDMYSQITPPVESPKPGEVPKTERARQESSSISERLQRSDVSEITLRPIPEGTNQNSIPSSVTPVETQGLVCRGNDVQNSTSWTETNVGSPSTAAYVTPGKSAPFRGGTQNPFVQIHQSPLEIPHSSSPELSPSVVLEISRLQLRSKELLSTGAYDEDDPLLIRINERITELQHSRNLDK
ncbi:hypothetical protein CEUSTIGMA_g875.t1 [Chlamydomonas eustigma]|uniref:C2 domain-containing protein n=1 Tax=Chlamydomonas eustigma TaxID=1157962 RepID=A0A250WRI9_9CHLO|nr:hypothetical protein CEUSTIGMA_g875.t1 [Chlamydomonas eustigma]|eukprot:GAX73423.1 hypothetical protein CEUSTIGMA_g875.t1 [Chlamydomonas eustigma]